jgi:transcriptional regulator with XRE-family HTH domain
MSFILIQIYTFKVTLANFLSFFKLLFLFMRLFSYIWALKKSIKMENQLRIKEILRERGISVTDFAEKLGIQRQNVYNVLNKPTWQRLEQCSEILDMPIADFFEKNDSEINGFIEYRGTIYRITDLRSFNNLAEIISGFNSKEEKDITDISKTTL